MNNRLVDFDAKVQEAIKYYVYALSDPSENDNKIFYVGKGSGNRCFDHIREARNNKKNTPKTIKIQSILKKGNSVKIDIIRHGLDEPTAHHVESALIEILKLEDLYNIAHGHGKILRMASAQEIQILYGAKPLEIQEPVILIKINQQYKLGMTIKEIGKAVSWCWHMNISRAKRSNYILAVAHGIVRGVFIPSNFRKVSKKDAKNHKDIGRTFFKARAVNDSPYLFNSTKTFGGRGQSNPIRYINC